MSSWICAARAASSTSSSVASGLAKRRFSRTVAWKRYVSCETTPTAAESDGNVRSRTSIAVDRHRAAGRVVEPRDEVGAGRLPGAGLADERGLRPRRDDEGHVLERPEASCDRPPPRPLVAEPDVVEGDVAARRARSSSSPRRCPPAGRGTRRSGRRARASSAPRAGRRGGCRSGRRGASAAW